MTIDTPPWLPVMLEAEREGRRKLERQNRDLRRKLCATGDIVKEVERPEPDWLSLYQQGLSSLWQQQQQTLRPQQQGNVFGGLLGWPWC